ncbi:MAG: hypothetical protein AAF362_01075 [Pseudomonadota bacterium]
MIDSHIYIICSDKARNGKTLFARLYADRLSLSGNNRLHVFDTDYPHGGIASYFPDDHDIIDLSRTQDQVQLFDTMIGGKGINYVVDLQASLLTQFFSIFHDISFDTGAREAGTGVVVYFIVDRSLNSIHEAEKVRAKLRCSEFVLVHNEAIGNALAIPGAVEEYEDIEKDRDLLFPKLSDETLALVESAEFSFSDFIAGNSEDLPIEIRRELWLFLEMIYNQRRVGGSETVHLI